MSRQLEAEDIQALYAKFAAKAIDTYNERQECMPMLAAVVMSDEPGLVAEAVFMHPALVNLFQRSAAAKDALMLLVRKMLAEGEAAGWRHLLEFDEPFTPDAIVHVSEVWVITQKRGDYVDPPRGSWEHHPGRSEALMVNIHTARSSYSGTCPIDDKAAPKRALFEPLRLDAKFFGRFSSNEAPDGPVH